MCQEESEGARAKKGKLELELEVRLDISRDQPFIARCKVVEHSRSVAMVKYL